MQQNAPPPLPVIYSEDKRVPNPEDYFRCSPRYQYIRLLGHGAYGLVCAAMDYDQGQAVAIKRINQINSQLVARRTLRELKLLRHFRGHSNIIAIVDLFKTDSGQFDELYISQELMDADLCHIVQAKFHLTNEHCQKFLYQILRGLKAIHSANVLHRDLKPGNLLWRHTGELKICDFGLARGMSEPVEGKDMTLTNYVATRWYRPPEILLYRSQYGKPLDMWSVGCIFAELLGRKVFLPGQSGFEQLHLILQKMGTPSDEVIELIPSSKSKQYLRRLPKYPHCPLSKRFPHAPPDAIDLLEKLLAFDPTQRITVEEALCHPYLARYHDPNNEPTFPPFDFTFDRQCESLADLKNCILDELRIYHPASISTLQLKVANMDLNGRLCQDGKTALLRDGRNAAANQKDTNTDEGMANNGAMIKPSIQPPREPPRALLGNVAAIPRQESMDEYQTSEIVKRYTA